MQKNVQYQSMLESIVEKLRRHDPAEIARKTGMDYGAQKQEFTFDSLGMPMRVHFPDGAMQPETDMWHHLIVLQAMDEADGTPLSDKWMGLGEFREGGLVRGTSFDRELNDLAENYFASADVNSLRQAAAKLGGTEVRSNADVSFRFDFLPRFPLLLHFWCADDEFPAGCKLLCNASAEHYLKVEAAGSAAMVLMNRLGESIQT